MIFWKLRTDLLHLRGKEQNTHEKYRVDSYAIVHYCTGLPPTRLYSFWHGPMRVTKGLNFCQTLLHLINGKEKNNHVLDVEPFVFDPAIVDPLGVARRDHMKFFVESILDHRGNSDRRSEMELLLYWLNYDDSHDSWEPHANLRDTDTLYICLRKIYSASSRENIAKFLHQFTTN